MSASTNSTKAGQLPTTGGYAGLQRFQELTNTFAALDGLVRQVMDGMAHCGPVEVVAVHGGGPSGAPTVDVRPMVNQVDGLAQNTPHGIVHGLPTFRLQAGNAAIIIDPIVGDKGIAIICDRDISTVKATKAQSGPGSFRSNSWADGCYMGEFFAGSASQYVQITQSGINIVTGGAINITSASLTHNGVNIGSTHVHKDTQPGGGNSGPPL